MIERVDRPLTRRALVVDDELAQPTTAGGRSVRALVEELRARGMDVVEAMSLQDGVATVGSNAAIHIILVNWTLGKNDKRSHGHCTDLLRAVRKHNAIIPIFLMADRKRWPAR